MLEFNNFRMVNAIELVSESQKSKRSQRFQCFMFIVDVHSQGSLPRFSLGFMFALILRIDVHIDPKVSRFQGFKVQPQLPEF